MFLACTGTVWSSLQITQCLIGQSDVYVFVRVNVGNIEHSLRNREIMYAAGRKT